MNKKIITYNVNGIRAAINKGFIDWIKNVNPDVICLQEIKANPEQFDTGLFENLGYQHYWYPAEKKGYSGVALLSKDEPDNVVYGCGIKKYDSEGRVIQADFGDTSIMSVYMPSGSSGDERQAFKMKWLTDFNKYIKKLRKDREKLIVSGDYNICHKAIDIHNPVSNKKSSGFLPEEREWMDKFTKGGFIDSFRYFNEDPHHYTWWSYRANARAKNLGWRIDYHMATENMKDDLKRSVILPEAKHSDHCPVLVEVNF
ncbi:MAG: exodeoxyribonuclease III [Bacteroidia bacterium]|nr:exodeoxyribonuclease III [Bacteroidia bacterium]NNM16328.1 exodeoxyribonuclease III [Bacteroidia bacterium]